MGASCGPVLFVILTNPPLSDGKRTLNRVALAAELLGFDEFVVANLFALPSQSSVAIRKLGMSGEGWAAAREPLEAGLAVAGGVLLAYGTTPPAGPARLHFRDQVAWLRERVDVLSRPVWVVGDGPRHPSRWQRWTHRAHPDLSFADALRVSFALIQSKSADGAG
jgi:hypothetical protein